jgi:outer membrane protein OmpA-like peptidoglycan-associated protein
MKRTRNIVVGVLSSLLSTAVVVLAQEDVPGSKDHPLLTRMPGFFISAYEQKDFDQTDFKSSKGDDIRVEGRTFHIEYEIEDGQKAPSEIQILRNYENAIQKIGGFKVFEVPEEVWLKVENSGQITWVYVWAHSEGESYELDIVEQDIMAQDVIADSASLARDISSTGHVSVYGIHFDFDKATVKRESDAILKEISKLLKQNSDLKLLIVGHTDNVGKISYNMELSRARAEAVVNVLVSKYGVAEDRLSPYGVGPLAPVASNETEEGRALNRRVELVKE